MAKVAAKNRKRIAVVFGIMALLFVVLAVRVAWIQVVKADDYTQRAINQQTSDLPIEANRGTIYDRNGNELATSATCYSVWVRPADIAKYYSDDEIKQHAKDLAEIFGKDAKDVEKQLRSESALIQIAKYLSKAQIDQVRELKIGGLETVENTKRYYPLGTTAASLLGSVNDDGDGRTGVEYQFDTYLSGVSGRWIKDTDINGNTLAYGSKKFYDAQDGYNVTLTLDVVLQHYAEKAITQGMKDTGAKRIMILVMDPKTGDILACAKTPSFDPNDPLQPTSASERAKYKKMSGEEKTAYLSEMWKNPLVSDLYEPGSTFKLLTTSAALEEGVTTPTSKYYDSGGYNVDGVYIKCWSSGHGDENLTEAVGNSCNPVMIQLALAMGKDTFYNYLDMFGITQATGVDLPGEASAIIKDPSGLTRVDLATMAFGHGVAVTPIQLLTAVNAIGNNGVVMKPRIALNLTDEKGEVVQEFETKEVRQVMSEKTADEMKDIMRYVVNKGGATTAKIEGYDIGGKTGTANKAVGGGYSEQVISSFVGMAPMDDPQISVLVIVDTPTKGFYGSEVAAPIGKAFLEDALPYLEVNKSSSSSSSKAASVTVPNVTGVDSSAAINQLRNLGLNYTINPEGGDGSFKVVDQYPKAGKVVDKGSTVYLYRE